MRKYNFIFLLIFGLLILGQPDFVHAQEKEGKLGDFEDANKGEKDSDEEDDDDNFWFGFLLRIGFSNLFENEDGYDNAESINSLTYGIYPYDEAGLVQGHLEGKIFMGKISAGYQNINSQTKGYRFNMQFQFAGRHGLQIDFIDYKEDLKTRTDHLQVIGIAYRNMLMATNDVLLAGNGGLKIINPDKSKDADIGLDFALDLTWFFNNPFSFKAKLGVAPIIDQLDNPEPPILWDLEIGSGFHFNNFEIFALYKSLIPSVDPGSAINGPQMGLRIWF